MVKLEGVMNKLQRQFRIVSDEHVEDTAVEMRACERAERTRGLTEAALADNLVTTSEALSILRAASATLADCEDSLQRNVGVQLALDAAIARLGDLPQDAIARLSRTDRTFPRVA